MLYKRAIRRLVISGRSAEVKALLLTDQQLEVYRETTADKGTTSREVASRLGISVPHASRVLDTLYAKGYAGRFEEPQPSGGFEWLYFSIDIED